MKNKHFINFTLLLVFLCLLLGCTTYEKLAPDLSELATWDGNYFYRGNIKTKSTGEDEETLVSKFTLEGITYEVNQIQDYYILDRVIYMILDAYYETLEVNVLLSYDPLSKEIQILYFTDNYSDFLSSIEYYSKGHFIIKKQHDNQESNIFINIETKAIREIKAQINSLYVNENYIIFINEGYIQYTKLDDLNFYKVLNVEHNRFRYQIINKHGVNYIRILKIDYLGNFTSHVGLGFFNLETKVYHEVWPIEAEKDIALIGDDYFMIGDVKAYEYISSLRASGSLKHEKLKDYLVTSNSLYKIAFGLDKVETEKIFEFDKDKDYMSGFMKDEHTIIFKVKWIKKGSELIPGGLKNDNYSFDLEKLKLSRHKEKLTDKSKVEQTLEANGYRYYFETRNYGPVLANYQAYYLYRVDLSSNKKEIIQFFAIENNEIKGVRYSSEFWKDGTYLDEEHFLILNY
ncbi:hypothetical protein [Acholeplasma hippikon]|uniref:Lipoprotein n=1 Tax=Acholeplasma hippikon TaxID=264636 RepID=A0A449BJS5_9MOLU|nr:hypothetical protein [Acholeplasma hippikon]VEU82702.1 Uncharacterised protein [Acholeplasma hippikon]